MSSRWANVQSAAAPDAAKEKAVIKETSQRVCHKLSSTQLWLVPFRLQFSGLLGIVEPKNVVIADNNPKPGEEVSLLRDLLSVYIRQAAISSESD